MRHEIYFSSNTPRCRYPYINDISYQTEISFCQQINKFLPILRQFLVVQPPPFRTYIILKVESPRRFGRVPCIGEKPRVREFPTGYSIPKNTMGTFFARHDVIFELLQYRHKLRTHRCVSRITSYPHAFLASTFVRISI